MAITQGRGGPFRFPAILLGQLLPRGTVRFCVDTWPVRSKSSMWAVGQLLYATPSAQPDRADYPVMQLQKYMQQPQSNNALLQRYGQRPAGMTVQPSGAGRSGRVRSAAQGHLTAAWASRQIARVTGNPLSTVQRALQGDLPVSPRSPDRGRARLEEAPGQA